MLASRSIENVMVQGDVGLNTSAIEIEHQLEVLGEIAGRADRGITGMSSRNMSAFDAICTRRSITTESR